MTTMTKAMKRAGAVLGMLLWGAVHAGTVTYVYTDPQGTPLMETDAQGNITARYEYTPYGVPVTSVGAAPDGVGYTGHVNDPETGLVYMQARYYDVEAGRFPSVDPIGPSPGNVYSFNRYAYVNNNPLGYIDPDGRQAAQQNGQQDSDSCDINCKQQRQRERERRNNEPFTGGGLRSPSGHIISIRSNVSSNAAFGDGHVWINDRGPNGLDTTYGLWPDSHPFVEDNGPGTDVRENMEKKLGYNDKYIAQMSSKLNDLQYQNFIHFVNTKDSWGYTHTCADWARDAYEAGTGIRLDVDDYFGIETPRELSRSLGH